MPRASGFVSLQDIASASGVHKATVHRALRGDARVEAGTAARIRAAAERLGYDPNANRDACMLSLRKSGRSVRTGLLALILPTFAAHGPYFHRPFVAFMETAHLAGHDVLLRIMGSRPDDRLPAPVLRGEADAVVALSNEAWLRTQQEAIDALAPSARRPVIGMMEGLACGWHVNPDFRQGGRLAVGHLLDLGHRRMIGIRGMSYGFVRRCEGYCDEMRARGLDPGRCLRLDSGEAPGMTLRDRIAAILDRLLAAMPDATAFLSPNDEVAILAAGLLAERGRPVPARMSLIGFDDTHVLPAGDGRNMLSTIALPLEQIGRAAAEMAMQPGEQPRSLLIPVGLRVRGSTAVPA